MAKKIISKFISASNFNAQNFSLYKKYKNGAIIYRCKFCHECRVKKENDKFIKYSGHRRHCEALINQTKKLISHTNNENSKKFGLKNESKNKIFLSIDNKKIYNKSKYSDSDITFNGNINLQSKKSKCYKNSLSKYNIHFILLKKIFDKSNHLNKYEEEIGSYYINRAKIIGEGAFTLTYLGEDKFLKINIAILEIKRIYDDNLKIESFILQRIHGKGNFPQLYMTYENDEYRYFIESLMGPNLHSLHKICKKNFDIFTILNIGIDIIKNL